MKKILFLAFSACLASGGTAFAQSTPDKAPASSSAHSTDNNRPTLQLTAGGALPLGDFGSKNANSSTSGLAKFGWQGGLAYAIPFHHKNYGFIIGLRGRLNSIDNDPNIAPLKEQYPGFKWSANNSSWKAVSAMAGLYYDEPATSWLDVHFEFGVGAAKAYVPTTVIMGTYDTSGVINSYVQARVLKNNATAFTGMAKIGVRFKLDEKWHILAGFDIWYLAPTFKNLTQTAVYAQGLIVPGYLSPNNAASLNFSQYSSNYKQTMTTLNLSVGVSRAL